VKVVYRFKLTGKCSKYGGGRIDAGIQHSGRHMIRLKRDFHTE
jgi:hypothetical protein